MSKFPSSALLSLLALTGTVAAQAPIDLGGGCAVSPATCTWYQHDWAQNTRWLGVGPDWDLPWLPHTWSPMLIGFDAPVVTLPSCGCTLWTTGDIIVWEPSIIYPAWLSGLQVFVQVAAIEISWAGGVSQPFPVPTANGCTEFGLAMGFSNGYLLTL